MENFVNFVRTIKWYAYGWSCLIFTYPLLVWVKYLEIRKLTDKKDNLVYSFTRKMSKNLIKITGSTITVTGVENIPESEPVLFVSNHLGHFDSAVIHACIEKPKGFVSIVEVLKIPILRTWMKHMKCIFIDRCNVKQSLKCMNQASEFLKQGHSMVIFPEGRFTPGDDVGPFKRGSLKMAIKASVPIVPVTILGTNKMMSNNGKRIKPAHIFCIVSKSIDTLNLTTEEKSLLADRVRDIISSNISNTHVLL